MGKPVTYDHLKSMKKPVTRTIRIATDSELAEKHVTLRREVDILKVRFAARQDDQRLAQELDTKTEELETLKKLLDKSSVNFVFRSIGRRKYDALIADNPPSEDQITKHVATGGKREDVSFDPETFPPALVASCLSDPQFTKEQVEEIWASEDWNSSELGALFLAAMEANTIRHMVDLGKG